MGVFTNLVGKRFDKLSVLKLDHIKKTFNHSEHYWKCKCDCGNEVVLRYDTLKYRPNRSCGCSSYKNTKFGKDSIVWKGCGDISGTYYRKLVSNAKTRDFKLKVSIKYLWKLFLKQNGKCALTGMDLSFDSRDKQMNGTASVDRIDSTLGYVLGNVQWIHKDVNRMKQHYPESYFVEMCNKVSSFKLKGLDKF